MQICARATYSAYDYSCAFLCQFVTHNTDTETVVNVWTCRQCNGDNIFTQTSNSGGTYPWTCRYCSLDIEWWKFIVRDTDSHIHTLIEKQHHFAASSSVYETNEQTLRLIDNDISVKQTTNKEYTIAHNSY